MHTKTTPPKEYASFVVKRQKPINPMKNYLLLAVSLLAGFNLQASPADPIPFISGELADVQRRAAQEGKLYFLTFMAEEVATCEWMDHHTFNDVPLVQYIRSEYLAAKIDVSQPNGMQLQYKYEVTQLPTILVFSSSGQLLGRHKGTVPAHELLNALKEYNTAANQKAKAFAPSVPVRTVSYVLPSPKAVVKIRRPRLVPNQAARPQRVAARPQAYSPPVATVREEVAALLPPAYQTASQAAEEQAVSRSTAPYYTVQVGTFSSYDNAVAAKMQLERQSTEKGTVVAFKNKQGQVYYRLCSGEFQYKAQAAAHQAQVRNIYKDAFVNIMGK